MAKKVISPLDLLKHFEKKDKDCIVKINEKGALLDVIPTGSWIINKIIGDGTGHPNPASGGFPRGSIVEVLGDESSGKTTLALSCARQVQLAGGFVVFIDFERSLHDLYMEKLGVDTDPTKWLRVEPRDFEHGARFIYDSLSAKPALIVVDSVAAMSPRAFIEGEIDESGQIGLHAKLMSELLKNILPDVKASNTCLLFLNQMRSMIKGQYERGPKEDGTGGKALRFYAKVRIKMEPGQLEQIDTLSNITGKKDKKAVNISVNVRAIKNKFDVPFRKGPVIIRFGEGFDNLMSIAILAINTKVIKKAGAFYSFTHEKREYFKVQGKEGLRKKLMEDHESFKKIRDLLKPQEDKEAEAVYSEENETDKSNETSLDKALADTTNKFKNSKKKKKDD